MELHTFEGPEPLLQPFIELMFRARADDPRWIPPFREDVRRMMVEAPCGPTRCFLVGPPASPLARCATVCPPGFQLEGEPAGMVGWYEALSPEAGQQVLEAALSHLREAGCKVACGPMDGSIWHGYRFMTRGSEQPPFYGEPRNPQEYPETFQRVGFEPGHRWYSWDLAEAHLKGMQAAAEQMGDPQLLQDYRLEPLDVENFDDELRRLHPLVVEGFRDNPAFTPLDPDEFIALFGGMKHFVIPELVPMIFASDGSLVAFGYLFPDIGPAIRSMRGQTHLLARLRFLWKKRKPDTIILHTVVVSAAHRRKGVVETFLAGLLGEVLERGFRQGVGALAIEGRTIYSKTGPASREYTLYYKRL